MSLSSLLCLAYILSTPFIVYRTWNLENGTDILQTSFLNEFRLTIQHTERLLSNQTIITSDLNEFIHLLQIQQKLDSTH